MDQTESTRLLNASCARTLTLGADTVFGTAQSCESQEDPSCRGLVLVKIKGEPYSMTRSAPDSQAEYAT